jgi:hypothetical protein
MKQRDIGPELAILSRRISQELFASGAEIQRVQLPIKQGERLPGVRQERMESLLLHLMSMERSGRDLGRLWID